MLKSLVIHDFQSHRASTIEFSPGVTVILGTSNSGKTSTVRAINWLVNNRPMGMGFIRKGQEWAEVSLAFTDTDEKVYRYRSKKENCYFVRDKAKLEALKGAVPEEVSEVVNFSDINIQSQLSPYFLVLDSPGKIAQYINRIVKLDEIQKVSSKINRKLSDTDRDLVRLEEEKDTVRNELQKLDKVDLTAFEKYLDEYEDNVDDLKNIYNKIETLLELIEQGREVVEELKLVPTKEDMDLLLSAAEVVETKVIECDTTLIDLIDLVKQWADVDDSMTWIADNIGITLLSAEKDTAAYDKVSFEAVELFSKVNALKECLSNIEAAGMDIENTEKEGKRVLDSLTACPYCEQKLSGPAKTVLLERA